MKAGLRLIFIITVLICRIPVGKSQNYLPYFQAMAAAETLLVDSMPQKALDVYISEFNKYPYIFPKDAYLAAQCAAFLRLDSLCSAIVRRGLVSGLDTMTIIRNPHTGLWWNRYGRIATLPRLTDSLRRAGEQNHNMVLKVKMVELIKKDQKLRNKNERYLNAVIFKHKLRPRLFRKWMQQADSQASIILHYTKRYGFPSHKTIGCNESRLYRKFGTSMRSTYATVILFHANSAWSKFKDELPGQLEKGNITPKQLALLRDFATRHYIYQHTGDSQYADYTYFIRWKFNVEKWDSTHSAERNQWIESNVSTIDSCRLSIGLYSYHTGLKMSRMQGDYYRRLSEIHEKNLWLFDFQFYEWD